MPIGDYPALMDPQTMGILSAAFGGLNASGPSLMPRSLGQVIGQAGQQGLGTYQNAWETQRKMAQTQAMVDLEAQKLKQAQAQFDMQQSILKQIGVVPGGGAALASPGAATQPPALGGAPQGGGNPAPQAGGSFPFSINQIAGMKLAGLPDLTATYNAANPPGIAQRPGAPITDPRTGRIIAGPAPIPTPGVAYVPDPSNPSGWKAVPVPNAAESAAGQAGAVARASAAATAPYKTVKVKLADGREITVPESYITGGAGQPPQFPLPKNVPESDRAAYEAVASGKVTRAFGEAPDPWSSMPKLETPTGMGQTTYQAEVQKKQGEAASELSTKYGAQAETANQSKATLTQALDLVDKADTGPLAARTAEVKSALVKFAGIPESDFENTPSASTALQKDLLNAATQKAKARFGSRMTQSEVMLMLSKGSPNVDMPKAAIKFLLESDIATSDYQIKQSNDLGQYLSKGGDPMRFEGWYSRSFPLANTLKDVKLNTGVRKYNPATGKIE